MRGMPASRTERADLARAGRAWTAPRLGRKGALILYKVPSAFLGVAGRPGHLNGFIVKRRMVIYQLGQGFLDGLDELLGRYGLLFSVIIYRGPTGAGAFGEMLPSQARRGRRCGWAGRARQGRSTPGCPSWCRALSVSTKELVAVGQYRAMRVRNRCICGTHCNQGSITYST